MKATLFLTTSCNLRCRYCYVTRQDISMPASRLAGAVDFAFQRVERTDRLDLCMFGGEPLLNWPLVQKAVSLIEQRSDDYDHAVRLSLVTNGTLLNRDILAYLHDHRVILQVSCDGLPHVQDLHRCFPDGRPSSAVVETNLVKALQYLPAVIVNMVYGPDTYLYLTDAIDYMAALGVKQMALNPDCTASWNGEKMAGLEAAFDRVGELYLEYYAAGTPLFISLIDEKISVILRGGYGDADRCRMGYQEFAFSPRGTYSRVSDWWAAATGTGTASAILTSPTCWSGNTAAPPATNAKTRNAGNAVWPITA